MRGNTDWQHRICSSAGEHRLATQDLQQYGGTQIGNTGSAAVRGNADWQHRICSTGGSLDKHAVSRGGPSSCCALACSAALNYATLTACPAQGTCCRRVGSGPTRSASCSARTSGPEAEQPSPRAITFLLAKRAT